MNHIHRYLEWKNLVHVALRSHKYSCGSEYSASVSLALLECCQSTVAQDGPNTCERGRSGRSICLSITICKQEANTKSKHNSVFSPWLSKGLTVLQVLFWTCKYIDLIQSAFIEVAIEITADWDYYFCFWLKQFSSNLLSQKEKELFYWSFPKFILGPVHTCLRAAILPVILHLTCSVSRPCGCCWVLKALTSLNWR